MKMTPELLEKAFLFAIEAHKGVLRKDGKRPYILHPLSVMARVYNFKMNSSNVLLLAIASILHDVYEDCEWVTIELIIELFGHQVAALVLELSTNKEECEKLGKATYLAEKMISMSSYALIIKLCDRLDNITDLISLPEAAQTKSLVETAIILNRLVAERKKLTKTHKAIVAAIKEKMITYNVKYSKELF